MNPRKDKIKCKVDMIEWENRYKKILQNHSYDGNHKKKALIVV